MIGPNYPRQLLAISQKIVKLATCGDLTNRDSLAQVLDEILATVKGIRGETTGQLADYLDDMTGRLEELRGRLQKATAIGPVDPRAINAIFSLISGGGGDPEEVSRILEEAADKTSIVCRECGKRFKSLRVHLRAVHGLSAEKYREKHGLPPEAPLICQALLTRRKDVGRKNRGNGGKEK